MRGAILAFVMCAIGLGQEKLPQGPHRAVVVALNEYVDAHRLTCPEADALAVGQKLKEFGWDVLMILPGTAHRPVSASVVKEKLTKHFQEISSTGTVLFYFAGHGGLQDGKNYLFLQNTRKEHLAEEGLLVDDVLTIMKTACQDSRPRHRSVLLIDACRNSVTSRGESGLRPGVWDELEISEGHGALFATQSGKTAEEPVPGTKFENEEVKLGFFTHFLLKSLGSRQADVDGDGCITLQEVDTYVQSAMARFRKATNAEQKPTLRWDGSGKIFLGLTPRDVDRPVVKVLSPSRDEQVVEGYVEFKFEVVDPSGISKVEARLVGGRKEEAKSRGNNEWMATIELVAGEHQISVQAFDNAGNVSLPTVFTVVVQSLKHVATPKASAVTPNSSGGTKKLDWLTFKEKNAQGFEEYTLNKDPTVVLIYVPGGTFNMGSTDSDAYDGEKPITEVTLSGYVIAKCETTWGQYERFCKGTSRTLPEKPAWSGYGDDHPVVNVSWEDAKAYCAWAGLRLPTEAQWEYAARGPDGRKWPWGSASPDTDASYANGSGTADGFENTAPVGRFSKGAGPFGTLDQAGNVWEWTSDAWSDKHPGGKQTNPERTGDASSLRVFRGGSFSSVARFLRGSLRCRCGPACRFDSFGFRPALITP